MLPVSQMPVTATEISGFVDRDRLIDRLARLVTTPSENPPGREGAAADLTAAMCEELGMSVSTHEAEPGRPSVIGRWQSTPGRTVAYCSHIDTVPIGDPKLWSVDPLGAAIDGDTLHGRGACDAKGPIAAALEAVAALRDSGAEFDGTLELDLVADEETMGFKGAGYLVSEGLISPDVAIVGEPTSLRVVRAQRGASWITISTKGVATHGSAPERGVNAIKHMAEIVLHLEETLPGIEHPVLGGPSIGVGTITGGTKVNVVPASCVAEIDRRSVPGETRDSVLQSIHGAIDLARRRFPDIDATVDIEFFAEPFEVPESSEVVQGMSQAVGDATGRDAVLMGFRGASDARFLAEAGAQVVLCGPGDIALAHTARESVSLREVETCAVAYALAFARLLGAEQA